MNDSNKIRIIHFSDLHYGDEHIFNEKDNLTLEKSVSDDLKKVGINSEKPNFIAVTGDLINKGKYTEYKNAKSFLNAVTQKLNCTQEHVFLVPGNHDVVMEHKNPEDQLKYYSDFYRDYRSLPNFCCVKNSVEVKLLRDYKIIIVELNSCTVLKSTGNGKKKKIIEGAITSNMISTLGEKLDNVKEAIGDINFDNCIKIALLHHHAMLLPLFFEKGKKDSNIQSIIDETTIGEVGLLDKLSGYGFHLILHGHKHHPLQYLHDPNSSWYPINVEKPILIVSGGCCGFNNMSHENDINARNTYNLIDVERNDNLEIKIIVRTRGLNTINENKKKVESDRLKWFWEDVKYRSFHFLFDKEGDHWGWRITTSTKDFNAQEDKNLILRKILTKCYIDDSVENKDLSLVNNADVLRRECANLQFDKLTISAISQIINLLDNRDISGANSEIKKLIDSLK